MASRASAVVASGGASSTSRARALFFRFSVASAALHSRSGSCAQSDAPPAYQALWSMSHSLSGIYVVSDFVARSPEGK